MATQALTLNVPDKLYELLKQRAAQTKRTVEDELLEVVNTALPSTGNQNDIPPELAAELAAMVYWSDKALWKAGRDHFPVKSSAKLEALHYKRQDKGLTETEIEQKDELLRQYNRYMLVRAEAAFLLKQRGHNVSVLLKSK